MPIRSGSTSVVSGQDIEAAPQVPDVLAQRVPARHGGVHQVGVADVVVLGRPVEPLAETAQIGGEDDVAPTGQLQRVVGVGHGGVLEAHRLGLARSVSMAGQDGGPRLAIGTGIRHQQVRGHRHGVLGVEDDLVPAVPVAAGGLEHLEIRGAPSRVRAPRARPRPGAGARAIARRPRAPPRAADPRG